MTPEQRYFIALSELENIYVEYTKCSVAHKILRNDIQSYVEYLEKQLQQKEDIINKAKEYIKNHKRNLIHEITHEEYEMLDEENIVNLLEILDNKGE